MRWLVSLLLLPWVLLGQTSNWPLTPDTSLTLFQASNFVNTTLAQAQTSNSTVLIVNQSSQISQGQLLQVDQEMELVSSGSGNTWTVIRGRDSTSQTQHSVNAPVRGYWGVSAPAAAYHNALVSAMLATQKNPFQVMLSPPAGFCAPDGSWASYLNNGVSTLYYCGNASWHLFVTGGGGGAGTVTSVAMTVPSWLSVAGTPILTAGTLAVTAASGQTTHQVIGTGSGTTFAPMTLGTGDLPFTYSGNTTVLGTVSGSLTNTHLLKADASGNIVDGGAPVAGGTVTSVTFTGDGTVLSSTPSAAVTSTGTVTAALHTALAHTVLGNFTGSTATPTYGGLTTAELPFTYGGNTTKLGTTTGALTNGHCVSIDANGNFVDSGLAGCGGSATGTVTSVAQTVPSWLTISGSPIVTSGTLAISAAIGQTSHTILGTFGGSSVSLGALGTADLPFTYSGNTTKLGTVSGSFTNAHCLQADASGNIVDAGQGCNITAGGTVTSFSSGNLSPLFTTSVATSTTTPALSFSLSTAAAHKFLGNNTGSTAAPSYASIGTSDLPFTYTGNTAALATASGALTNGHCASWDASGNIVDFGSACGGGGGGGTVTSVGLSMPAMFTVTNSPVIASGTLTAAFASAAQNLFLATPNGSSGVPSLRAIVAADIPTLNQNTTGTASNVTGIVAIANGGTGNGTTVLAHKFFGNITGSSAAPAFSTLGTGDLPFTYTGNTTTVVTSTGSRTNGHCVSIDASGNFVDSGQPGCGGAGTVTNVGFAAPSGFVVSGSPVMTSGTLTLGMPAGWVAGDLLLGSGSNVVSRLGIGPNGTYLKSNGTTASWAAGGTVTSVGLTAPAEFTVGGTPVTSSGTLSLLWAAQPAHKFFGNPSVSSATPGFSSIGTGDLPYTYGGNTTKLGTTTGTLVNGHCVSIDANGNFVDAGAGCAGAGGNNFANSETPAGTVNGINTTFTLVNSPNPALALQIYRNGLEQAQGVDYTLSSSTITFLAGAVPQTGDTLRVFYRF